MSLRPFEIYRLDSKYKIEHTDILLYARSGTEQFVLSVA